MKKIIYISLFLFINALWTNAQYNTVGYLFMSEEKKADLLVRKKAYSDATKLYQNAFNKKNKPSDIALKLANTYKKMNDLVQSEYWYSQADSSSILNEQQFEYAEILLCNGKTAESEKWFRRYNSNHPTDILVTNRIKSLEHYTSFYKDTLQYSIGNLSLNSSYSDFAPVLYKNGIVFTSARPSAQLVQYKSNSEQEYFYDLYYVASGETVPEKFSSNQSVLHEGPICFYENNSRVLYSSSLKNKSGITHLGLFYADFDPERQLFKNVKAFPYNNGDYSVSHPYFDEKTQILYFVSDMEGGYGGTDLYSSYFNNGEWSVPKNMGIHINSPGNEMFPFVSEDQHLYFSSNGLPGMGGMDIYKISLTEKSLPENMGAPVNSTWDDFSLILQNASQGYFCSNRNSESGDDIYSLRLYSSKMNVVVRDELNSENMDEVSVKLFDSEKNTPLQSRTTNKSGTCEFTIIPGKKYQLKSYKSGYAMHTAEFISYEQEKSVVDYSIQMERSNKYFIKGTVLNDTIAVPFGNVQIMDFSSDSILYTKADSTGKFICQINSDTTNVLYVSKDGQQSLVKLDAVKRDRKGSGFIYITFYIEPPETKFIWGSIARDSGNVVSGDTLYLVNHFTQSKEMIVADEQGNFKAEVWKLGRYSLYRSFEEFRSNDINFVPLYHDRIDIILRDDFYIQQKE